MTYNVFGGTLNLTQSVNQLIGLLVGDGHTVTIRTCSVDDWGSQCGEIFFEQGDEVEKLKGCLASCNFDGCNIAMSILCLAPYRYILATVATTLAATIARPLTV